MKGTETSSEFIAKSIKSLKAAENEGWLLEMPAADLQDRTWKPLDNVD